MMSKTNKLMAIAMIMMMMSAAMAQNQSEKKQDKQPAAAVTDVSGSGTSGQIPKWTGTFGTSSFVLGNSIISEDKFGNIGIGTTAPTAKLTVRGMIETTLGGLRFPDGTVQTTSATGANFALVHDTTLTGNGTSVSPLGINIVHDATLMGSGTVASPLGIKLPLNLTATGNGIGINVTGGAGCIPLFGFGSCDAIVAQGGSFGIGVTAIGGPDGGEGLNARGLKGPGIISRGADVAGSFGAAEGVSSQGGMSDSGTGGAGISGAGGNAPGDGGAGGTGGGFLGGRGGATGGTGVVAIGGTGVSGTGGVGLVVRAGGGNTMVTPRALAGHFMGGDVNIDGGTLRANRKLFHIDHPLDPENKYLNHASIESSEVLNIYSGNITTDESGDAIVTLPGWFEALNKDCRYQLTVIGTFAQAIVAEKIKGNRFVIKTNAPNVEVSWQITGVRSDPATLNHPLVVEEDKPERERGYYLNPEAYDQPEEKNVNWAQYPELMRQIKEARKQMKRKPQQR